MDHVRGGPPFRFLRLLASIAIATLAAIPATGGENPGKRKASAATASVEEESGGKPAAARDVGNPVVQLICDPQVQAELSLSPRQLDAVQRAYAKIEPRLWLLRDVGSGPGADEKAKLSASLEAELGSLLEGAQASRLRQLVLRARGWPGLTIDEVARQLKLSDDQLERIAQITEQTRQEIQKLTASNDTASAREQSMRQLRTREGESVQKLLSAAQRRILAELVGDDYDLGQVRLLTFAAPDFKQVDEWVHTGPLKLSDLRGKVVAFHFWAFGCINCVHNLPHYTKWHDQLASKGLVVLGMHTPETQAERSVAALRAKIDEHSIRYPVAVDHDAQNWAAWANSMWPSVYLIDRRGRVRFWWYGELNWQGAEGEKWMREKIEQLLAEAN